MGERRVGRTVAQAQRVAGYGLDALKMLFHSK
jgi:hypothetical protein